MKKQTAYLLGFIILTTFLGILFWYELPINRIKRAFRAEDYKTVVQIYPDLTKKENKEYVQEKLAEVADQIYEDYFGQHITYEDAAAYYRLVMKRVLRKNSRVSENKEKMDEICHSRELFSEGTNLHAQGKYLEAIAVFQQISELDTEFRKQADSEMEECRKEYCSEAISKADECIAKGEFREAREMILDAIAHFHEEVSLIDKLWEIERYLRVPGEETVEFSSAWITTYNLGELIAEELEVSDFELYFPVKLVWEFGGGTMKLYVDKESIQPALEALTEDAASMDAVYSVASKFGISKMQADFLVKLMYGGSYSDFILDYFEDEINEALGDFSFHLIYCADASRIYVGTKSKNEDNFLVYTEEDDELIMTEYVGNDRLLSLLAYPLIWERR